MTSTAIIIIAGGGAARMNGADKPLLNVRGTPVLDHILSALHPQGSALALNVPADRAASYRSYQSQIGAFVHDQPGAPPTPVAGIMAGMVWAADIGAQQLLTWPGDSPFPPPTLVERLTASRRINQAAAPHDGTRLQVLASLWPVIDPAQLMDCKSVHRALETIGFDEVDFSDHADDFANINTTSDWHSLKRETPR